MDADELQHVRAGIAVTAEGHGYDADRGELWFAGETGEAVLLELDARRRALADEADELAARAEGASREADDAIAHAAREEAAYAEVAHLRSAPLDAALLARLSEIAEGLAGATDRAAAVVARLEAPVNARLNASERRSHELGDDLRRLAALEADARREAAEAARRAADAELVLARLGGAPVGSTAPGDRTRDELAGQAAAALAEADEAAARALGAADAARAADAALLERAPRRSRLDVDLLRRLVGTASSLGEAVLRASVLAGRFEAPVRARVDAGAARASELGASLRRLGAAEVELRRVADEASERATTVEVELARLDGESVEAQRRLDDALGAGAVTDEDLDGREPDVDRSELAARITRLESRREALGMVNPLAKEEYEAEKARLDELSTQRADLEASLAELAALRDELTETVNRRFDETFAAVAANFEEVASTLFPGGEGRLRLVEPEEDDGPGADAGVEVELRPAGKRITRLTLLSGGEKALGAISFLFALFLAKPCPFYLLDEVEAALDDTNIARFVELLRRYADRAQFVVITHQKRTMEAADVLYGVTMGRRRCLADRLAAPAARRARRGDRLTGPRPGQLARADRPTCRAAGFGLEQSPVSRPVASVPLAMSRTWAELLGDGEEGEREDAERSGFFSRLRESLGKSRRALVAELGASFDPSQEDAWERLEVALLRADVGVTATAELVRRLEARGDVGDLAGALAEEVEGLFGAPPVLARAGDGPTVVLVVGVNGTGKTTTIGKLAQKALGARAHGARRGCRHVPRRRGGAARDLGRPRRSGLRGGIQGRRSCLGGLRRGRGRSRTRP